ncbi:superfamily II DNA or RNA helicase [Amorphus sp. MBR-141]
MPDLFDLSTDLLVPPRLDIKGAVHGNALQSYAFMAHRRQVRLSGYSKRGVEGYLASDGGDEPIFLSAKETGATLPTETVLVLPQATDAQTWCSPERQKEAYWYRPKPKAPALEDIVAGEARCRAITEGWTGQFVFKQEDRESTPPVKGLRRPQIGALYAALAHWSVGEDPATIVMPTGTGKTETMLALLVCARLPRLMVVVPNTALRDQIADKFLTLGKLADCGCVPPDVRPPVVAMLRRRPSSAAEVDDIFRRANVIVATMNVAGQCSPEVQERMAVLCSHLFIDEAHHIAARTWAEFKRRFREKPILQFTATPFRMDGKRIDGKYIYTYPLSRAQKEGYFRVVNFVPVAEYDPDDAEAAIADRAGRQLQEDCKAGRDHLLMARVRTTKRADDILALYRERFAEFSPVAIHTGIPVSERRTLLQKLRDRESRIVVCVDMFGEGFDMPQLKVAALHDRHQSLPITLQFIGRFTRDLEEVGDAHVVANIADEGISDALRNLYAEDSDWNHLLKMLSEAATERARKRNEVLAGFTGSMREIPLQTLFPRMSAVAYKTDCANWNPLQVEDAIPGPRLHAGPVVNPEANIAIYVTRDEGPIRWGAVKQIQNVEWNLHVLHWNEQLGILFINSSSKDFHEGIADAVCGSKTRFSGENMFRVLGGVRRLTLTNLGLSHALGKNIRYTMFMGADIADGLSEASKFNRRKSNLFGLGYEEDEKVTIGCSAKGRLWSYRVAYDLSEWTDWCSHVGAKLLDENISIEDVLTNVIKARRISTRPSLVPVMVSWPEGFLSQAEDQIELEIGQTCAPFFECELTVSEHTEKGPLRFSVIAGTQQATFEVALSEERAEFKQTAGPRVFATVRGATKTLAEWFNDDPPIIHFANGDFLVFNELFELPRGADRQAFDPAKISAWTWDGIDLRKESQGQDKSPDSIQRHVIERILAGEFGDFDVVFDGDGTGEVADIVGLVRIGEKLRVLLVHCKHSAKSTPGARIDDFYAVCGQAQKSVHWRENPRKLLKHLLHQEELRLKSGGPSRFERGGRRNIQKLISSCRELSFAYEVAIVQPGLSKVKLAPAFLDVLGATETFLQETFSIPLQVIASAQAQSEGPQDATAS